MGEEPLDDSYRRLSPYQSNGRGGPPPAPDLLAGMPPQRAPTSHPLRTGPSPGLAIVVASVLVVAVIAGGIGGIALLLSSPGPTTATGAAAPTARPTATPSGVEGWVDYPGSATIASESIVRQTSKADAVARSRAFIDEVRRALTREVGVRWSSDYPEYEQHSANGYGGDSMLWDHQSRVWQGVVPVAPGVRERIRAVFDEVAESSAYADWYRENDSIEGDDAESKSRYGASRVSEQPLWRLVATNDTGYASASVLDGSLDRDITFTGGADFDLSTVAPGSVTVSLFTGDFDLLDDADREAFAQQLSGFDEFAKPAPIG